MMIGRRQETRLNSFAPSHHFHSRETQITGSEWNARANLFITLPAIKHIYSKISKFSLVSKFQTLQITNNGNHITTLHPLSFIGQETITWNE